MNYQFVNFQKSHNIMIINIRSPRNDRVQVVRFSDELKELCEEISQDEGVRVIILTSGDEKSFSFETELLEPVLGEKEFWPYAESIFNLKQPIIAAIHGNAIGQGLELALACDIRIAGETSHFGLPQMKSGFMPWDGGTQRLSRLVGKGKALEMILTGEMIDAQEAYRIGLVNRIVPPDKLTTVTMDIAQEIASKGPIALRYAKEAIYKGMDMTLEQGLRLEADLYLLIHTTKDRAEGIQAFREKRTPKFEGK